MSNSRVVISVVILIALLVALYTSQFEKREIPDVSWDVDYKYESKEPYGAWLLNEILKESYGEEKVVKLENENRNRLETATENKGYLVISNYLTFDQSKVNQLADFVTRGNKAILITSSLGYFSDSLLNQFFSQNYISDTLVSLKIKEDTSTYTLTYFDMQFDTSSLNSYTILDSLDKRHSAEVETLSYLDNSHPVFIKFKYGKGSFYLHTVPEAFSNVGIKQQRMKDYAINVLPFWNIDTLYLDHDTYNPGYEVSKNPLQFVMSQSALKWAYFLGIIGMLLYVVSRAKRRQRIIPTLPQNENTSLEYVHTLSELYRSQNQHYKLATHLRSNFEQWIKSKYFIKPGEPNYISKISHKSKIPEELIEKLLDRMNAAIGNRRFGADQLDSIFKDIDQFYKNCK